MTLSGGKSDGGGRRKRTGGGGGHGGGGSRRACLPWLVTVISINIHGIVARFLLNIPVETCGALS